jgi:uncharacterized protein YjbJ (UPF0337 family)
MRSNATRRSQGALEEIGGKIKRGVGKLVGDERMQAEGRGKELKGQARQETAKASERSKGTVEELVGSVKNRVGRVIGNRQMQAEGKAKALKGRARQRASR